NRIAHHLVLEQHERAGAGPAWVLGQFTRFETGTPEIAERERSPVIPSGDLAARPATAWEVAGFDPGWAGIVAQALLDAPQATVYVVLPEMLGVLPLVIDVLALLPADRRWHVTFSTRPLVFLPHVRCQLRFVRADAPGLARLLAEPSSRVIRVEANVDAGESDAAMAARRGATIEPSVRPTNTKVHPVLGAAVGSAGDGWSAARPGRTHASVGEVAVSGNTPDAVGAAPLLPIATSARSGHERDASLATTNPREPFRWPPLAILLLLYAALASLGALILFILAATRR
ncbi:MAG: hypothetical protein ACKO3W_04860, partial [bacterium]